MLKRVFFAGVAGISLACVQPAAAQVQKASTQAYDLCGNKASVTVTPPGTDADPNLAKFSGVWGGGEWSGGLCNAIAVTAVKGNVATVQYFWGTAPGIQGPGTFTKTDATIKGKYLSFKSQMGADVSYEIVGGQLRGWFGGTELSKKLQKM